MVRGMVMKLCFSPVFAVDDIVGEAGSGEEEKDGGGEGGQDIFHGAFLC
jgi:hypothetical protein